MKKFCKYNLTYRKAYDNIILDLTIRKEMRCYVLLAWLKDFRTTEKKTMLEVSKACGISESYYSQIENGKRKGSHKVRKNIAKVLNFDWQLFYVDENSQHQSSA